MLRQLKQLGLGVLAGLAIGLGSVLFIISKTYIPGEYGKIISGLLFPVGLTLICSFSLSLFTGKIGLVFEKKQENWFYLSLIFILIGNAIGAIGTGYLCYAIFKNNVDVMGTIENVCLARTSEFESISSIQPFISTFIKGLACGLCVYFSVKSFAFARYKLVGYLLLIFFVFFFVYFGFEHCIANMFYFSMNNSWTAGAFVDLFLAIAANSLGTIPGVLLLKLAKKI